LIILGEVVPLVRLLVRPRKPIRQLFTNRPADIKNPITIAHIVLKESIKPLSLSRVPPNLLVGDGVADFAAENDEAIVPHDLLITPVARDRWEKWTQDLEIVAERERKAEQKLAKKKASKMASASSASPPTTPDEPDSLISIPTPSRPLAASAADLPNEALLAHAGHTPHIKRFRDAHPVGTGRTAFVEDEGKEDLAVDPDMEWESTPPPQPKFTRTYDGSSDIGDDTKQLIEYNITDTVGAIAIDGWGNIAAGSSSGGIGMKHKGRCGPAALVGIGTAVIPRDPDDEDEVSVATVVSGTGEHMATTMAAATAADRVYCAHRKEGVMFKECSEDDALHDMIAKDFLSHPAVRLSPCPGAIGVVAVKRQKSGIYFYFAHNTDSFALASMHSEERKPVCVMSRNKGTGGIAQGGRLSRSRYARRSP
jgi:taspase, threonine aspartase, 1